MVDIEAYNRRTVEISKSILLEVLILLNEYKENFVLVGGWVPYFLLERYKSKDVEFNHIGSVDIDIALDHKSIPDLDEVYESIRQKLERNNYRIRKSRDNQPIPHSFEKEIQKMLIHVDFLASEYGGSGKQHRHQKIQDILAIKARGIDLAFQNNEIFEIEGLIPNKARYRTEIKVSGVVAVITMKAIAFDGDKSRTKDIYDICSILKYYKEGVGSVITEVKPFLNHKLVIEAIKNLSFLFSTIDSMGPIVSADFVLPGRAGSEDWEFYRRDSFELIQDLLEGLM